jgi:hypothetical protein
VRVGEHFEPGRPFPKAADAGCASLYRRFQKTKGLADFACARAPSGELWASVVTVELLPEDPPRASTPAQWKLVVQSGARISEGPPQRFDLTGGVPCVPDPPACLGPAQHFEGVRPPMGFRFADIDLDHRSEAFAIGSEEVTTAGPFEFSITLWRLGAAKVELHELSQRGSIIGLAACAGDARPEIAYSPYRTAGSDTRLRALDRARFSSQYWSLLAEFGPHGELVTNGPAAQSYSRRDCTEPDPAPFTAPAHAWPQTLHCAKLWGTPPKPLLDALASACEQPLDDEARDACHHNRAVLERMAQTSLPFVLSDTAAPRPLPEGCFDAALTE